MTNEIKDGDVVFFANEKYQPDIFAVVCKPDYGKFGFVYDENYLHFMDAHAEGSWIEHTGGVVLYNIYTHPLESNVREIVAMLRPDADWSTIDEISTMIEKEC